VQGYQGLLWDVDTRDRAGAGAAAIVAGIHAPRRGGADAHDGRPHRGSDPGTV